jgi:serine/threonine protein kinase
MRLLTPSFASPEQIRGERVSVASDVYSLGVVLYQLLTGSLPFQFASLDVLDIERVITGAEPVSPSVAVLRTGAEVARNRSTSPERLARALRGDLDTIVATALRKDPARRYASVEQFSDDIGRYLSGQPVRARRDTTLYVAGKFVRRHAAALAAVAVIILLLTSFAVGTTVGAYCDFASVSSHASNWPLLPWASPPFPAMLDSRIGGRTSRGNRA